MSQDEFGRIGFFEDFQGLTDDDDQTLTSGTPVRWKDVLMVPISGNVTQNVVVDEGGGVISFSGAGAAADGIALISAPMQPSGNGTIRMGARFKLSAVTDMRVFCGFQETCDRDATVNPFTLNGTTLTANNGGQAFGIYYDTQATVDDFRVMGSSDGTAFTTPLGTIGVRAYSTPVLDEYMVVRVEIDPNGVARVFYGDSSTDLTGTGLNLVKTLAKDILDEDALYHPHLHIVAQSTGNPTFEVDYFWAKGNRDWNV